MITIGACDPGTMTGLAVARVGRYGITLNARMDDVKSSLVVEQVDCHNEDAGIGRVLDVLMGCDVVVMEDFRLYAPSVKGGWNSDPSGLSPVRIAHIVRWELVGRRGWHDDAEDGSGDGSVVWPGSFVWQMPGERSIITDERLKRWGLWTVPSVGGGPHARDATRHLLKYVRSL